MMAYLVHCSVIHVLTKLFDFATQAASGGDNAENMGMGPSGPEEEGDDETSSSDGDVLNCEGDTSSLSDGTSSDEADDERYKDLEELFGKDNLVFEGIKIYIDTRRRRRKLLKKTIILGAYHDIYLSKQPYRVPVETGLQWVERQLRNANSCYNMFRMQPHVFESLHQRLVSSYGLKSTRRMSSREALGLFLYMVGPPQPVRQAENRFERSMETVCRKFHHVMSCVVKLAKDIICPKDPTFSLVHHKVANHRSAPAFNNAIGAIDGTHVKVVVPFSKAGQYINRQNEKTQNVLAICDFDRRFTFVATGIPRSAHDWIVLQQAILKYGPNSPPGYIFRLCALLYIRINMSAKLHCCNVTVFAATIL